MKNNITFCLMTCGEETEGECLRAIEPFRDRIEYTEARNIFPQIKALNYMIDSVWTDYFVALDADMILDKNAFDRLNIALDRHGGKDDWHTILFSLHDTLTEKNILGLKLMRTKYMKEHKFVESATPDVEHYERLTKAGLRCVEDYINTPPIGKHVVRGHHYCYHKYRDVYLTYRSHGRVWDCGAFMGGSNIRDLSKGHFDFFFYRWAMTDNWDYLSCIAGMADGLTSSDLNESKSLEKNGYRVNIGAAPIRYLDWYGRQESDLADMLF